MSWMRLKNACVGAGQYGPNIPASDYTDEGTRLIRTTDLATGRLNPEGGIFVPGPVIPNERLAADDLLLSRSGTVGRAFLVPEEATDMTFAGFLVRFRHRSHVSPRYLFYATQSQHFQDQVLADAVTSTIQNFNAEKYAKVAVWIPGEESQRVIVAYLDDQVARIDEIIRLREEQVDLLAARRLEHHRAATTHGEAEGRTATGVEWMPSIGLGWVSPRMSMVFRFGSGTTPRTDNPAYFEGDVPWINTGDLRDAIVSQIRKTVTRRALSEVPALRVFEAGALAVAMYGATAGRVGLMQFPACVNQACCVLEPLGDISAEWAFYWFIAHRPEIMRLAYGGGQPNISQETIRGLRIPVPPSVRQQRQSISSMHRMDEQLNESRVTIGESVELLLERKRSLITAAVTGEFDVSTASGRGVA